MKKILLLGGSAQQIVAIETAKKLGYYTVLCDFLPDNPGQYHADAFYLVSTTDKEAVLEVARKENVQGVLAYASDPAAPTAAYVAESLGLFTNSYDAVQTLCNKNMFRLFLADNGFNTPKMISLSLNDEIPEELKTFKFPVIVKPVDSSGSKGVTVLYNDSEINRAIDFAFQFSRNNKIIIEEFIEKKHSHLIGGDIFVKDGKIVLWGLLNCHRDSKVNELVPVGKSFPLNLEDRDIENVKKELQKLVDKLQIKAGAMNVEIIVDKNDLVWFVDVGPRNGGNMIPDLLGMIFGVDIVKMTIQTAMNENVDCSFEYSHPFYATHNLHSSINGIFDSIQYSKVIESHIIREHIYKKKGDVVEYFDNAAKALGIVFLKFDNYSQMHDMLEEINKHIVIVLK